MRYAKIVTSLAALGLMGLALADDSVHTKIAIVVEDGVGDPLRIELDSQATGFDLHDLQEGESRSVIDDEGRSILVTRHADTFRFDVDGRTVDVPIVSGEQHAELVTHSKRAEVVDIEVVSSAHGAGVDTMDSTMIVTAEPVDTATQDAIRAVLESAGHSGNVLFIDRTRSDGPQRVKIVEKKIDVVKD